MFLKKLLHIIPIVIGATLVAFFLIRLLPGDPVTNLLGERGGRPEVVAELREKYGLDKPIFSQYLIFVKNSLTGEWGSSIVSKQPVLEEFIPRFMATIELSFFSMLIAVGLGIPLGVLAATYKNKWPDYLVSSLSLIGYSMPIFWWGLILIILFSVRLSWFPVSGRLSVEYDVVYKTGLYLIDAWFSPESFQVFKSAIRHLTLPSIVLSTIPLAVIARMTRASMIECLNEDYIKAAVSRGVSKWKVYYKHALRNALIPVVTTIGIMVGTLLTGAVLTETIFSWPGIGNWLVKSVEARDYPVIQMGVLYFSLLIIVINLLVEQLNIIIYPKLRLTAKKD